MTSSAKGTCLCGASSFTCTPDVKFAIQCHCRDCQHISGGGHLPQIAVPAEAFQTTGPITTYQTTSDAGNTVDIAFCSTCGSPLFKATSKMPDVKFLCAGALDEDLLAEPFHKVFEDCRRVWDT